MGVLTVLAKGVIGTFSILIAIIGVVFLAIAGVVAVEFRSYVNADLFKNVYLWGPVAVAILLGVFLLLLGVFGVIGVFGEKKALIKLYAVMMILLIILEVVLGILAFVFHDKLGNELQRGIEDGIVKAYGNGSSDTVTRDAINKVQDVLNCCGGNGTQDYTRQNITVPTSCCVTVAANCTTVGSPQFNTEGCTTKLIDAYKKYANIFFGVGITFAVLQVLAVIYSCYAVQHSDMSIKIHPMS